MKNIWTILLVIIAVIVGIRVIVQIFSVGFSLIRIVFPIALFGFAIYGFLQFLKNR